MNNETTTAIYPTLVIWGKEVAPFKTNQNLYSFKELNKALGLSMRQMNAMLLTLPKIVFMEATDTQDAVLVKNDLTQYVQIHYNSVGNPFRAVCFEAVMDLVRLLSSEDEYIKLCKQVMPFLPAINVAKEIEASRQRVLCSKLGEGIPF